MDIVVFCEKHSVESTITTLECEGYHITECPARLRLDEDTNMSTYCIVGERPNANQAAISELKILCRIGWLLFDTAVHRVHIGGDRNDYVDWPY